MRIKMLVIGLLCLVFMGNVKALNDSTKVNYIEECLMPLLQERFNYNFDTIQFCEFFILDGIPIENSPQYRSYHGYFCEGTEYVKIFWIGNIYNNLFHNSKDCKILMLKSLSYQKKKEKKEFIRKIRNKGFAENDTNIQYRVNKKIVKNDNFEAQFSDLKFKHIEMFEVYNNPNIIDEEGKKVNKLIEIFLFE